MQIVQRGGGGRREEGGDETSTDLPLLSQFLSFCLFGRTLPFGGGACIFWGVKDQEYACHA